MLSASLLQKLQAYIGSELEILTEADGGDRFHELAQGWTNIGRETPGAIILPLTEEQTQKTVRAKSRFLLHICRWSPVYH